MNTEESSRDVSSLYRGRRMEVSSAKARQSRNGRGSYWGYDVTPVGGEVGHLEASEPWAG